jgi:hypothetical protein
MQFRVQTSGNKENNTIKLILNGRSHGTFKSLEDLIHYAGRVRTGLIVLVPGAIFDQGSLVSISNDIKVQVNNLRKMGFK